jgi:hypothetical protein
LRGLGGVPNIPPVIGRQGSHLLAALGAALLLAAAALPAFAAAEVENHTFVNPANIQPSGDANATVGVATLYPDTIEVPSYPGTITKVTATILDLSSGRPEDIDMALVSPDGTAVMLMSDACGNESQHLGGDDWTFDDDASIFLSRIGCRPGELASFKPTNYFEEEHPDELEVLGVGPSEPHNELAEFDGEEPGGTWQLYVLDDSMGVVGFEIGGWSLSIDVEGPPPTTPPVTTPPATGTTTPPATGGATVTAPPAPAPAAKPKRTGRRAAALARCKKKKAGTARRRCRIHARALPV